MSRRSWLTAQQRATQEPRPLTAAEIALAAMTPEQRRRLALREAALADKSMAELYARFAADEPNPARRRYFAAEAQAYAAIAADRALRGKEPAEPQEAVRSTVKETAS